MLESMTGFSSINVNIPARKLNHKLDDIKNNTDKSQEINVSMTLKSLNSRFFELTCKVPFALSQLEIELFRFFKKRLRRGNIYFSLYINNSLSLNSRIIPSLNIIADYINSIKEIKKKFDIKDSISITDLLTLPNIFEQKEEQVDYKTYKILLKSIDELTQNLLKNRQQEGETLKSDLTERLETINKYLKELESRAKIFFKEKKLQLNEVLKKTVNNLNQENSTEMQSLIIYNQLDKIDIHEEIVRFKSHLFHILEFIKKSNNQEKGKKIDFTLQELFREVNTITSKCADSQISEIAINIKVELEKAREQAQNIV